MKIANFHEVIESIVLRCLHGYPVNLKLFQFTDSQNSSLTLLIKNIWFFKEAHQHPSRIWCNGWSKQHVRNARGTQRITPENLLVFFKRIVLTIYKLICLGSFVLFWQILLKVSTIPPSAILECLTLPKRRNGSHRYGIERYIFFHFFWLKNLP